MQGEAAAEPPSSAGHTEKHPPDLSVQKSQPHPPAPPPPQPPLNPKSLRIRSPDTLPEPLKEHCARLGAPAGGVGLALVPEDASQDASKSPTPFHFGHGGLEQVSICLQALDGFGISIFGLSSCKQSC